MDSPSSTSSSDAPVTGGVTSGKARKVRDPYSCTNPPDGFVDFLEPRDSDRTLRTGRAAWPWGGVGALVMVLLFQHFLFSPSGPWEWQLSRLQGPHLLDRGLINDRIELGRALATPLERPRVTVVGTSRMEASFREELIDEALRPPIDFFARAHTRLFPHEIASQADEILAHGADLVLITVSEMELLTPLKLVPQAWGGQLDALFDLMVRTGPGFVFDHRDDFMRMISAGLSESYRFRTVIGKTIVDRLLHVDVHPTNDAPGDPIDVGWPDVLADGEPFALTSAAYDGIIRALQTQFADKPESVRFQTRQVRAIRPGAHGQLKLDIMERNIREFRAAGVEVLLFEGVLHPLAAQLYDEQTSRAVFLAWAQRMAAQDGVFFLSRDKLGPVPANEFRDVTHVNKLGAQRITLTLLDWCAWHLTPDWRQALKETLEQTQGPPADAPADTPADDG